jgi:hypothetical protein
VPLAPPDPPMSPVPPLSAEPPEPEPPASPLPPLPPGLGSGAGVVPVPPPGLVVLPVEPPEPPGLPLAGLLSFAGGESEACVGGGVFVVSAVASVAVPEAGVGSVGSGGRTGVSAFALARAAFA